MTSHRRRFLPPSGQRATAVNARPLFDPKQLMGHMLRVGGGRRSWPRQPSWHGASLGWSPRSQPSLCLDRAVRLASETRCRSAFFRNRAEAEPHRRVAQVTVPQSAATMLRRRNTPCAPCFVTLIDRFIARFFPKRDAPTFLHFSRSGLLHAPPVADDD